MARSKRPKAVAKMQPVELEEPIVITDKTEVILEPTKDELKDISDISKAETMEVIQPDENEITVIGLASAEFYQKSGWQLLEVSRSGFNKVYKFRKVN